MKFLVFGCSKFFKSIFDTRMSFWWHPLTDLWGGKFLLSFLTEIKHRKRTQRYYYMFFLNSIYILQAITLDLLSKPQMNFSSYSEKQHEREKKQIMLKCFDEAMNFWIQWKTFGIKYSFGNIEGQVGQKYNPSSFLSLLRDTKSFSE